jgi:heme A synthase
MAQAPLGLSAAHQALAAIVLAIAVTLAWRTQRV